MGVERALARLAASQHGLVIRSQATELGLTDAAIKWRCADGVWRALHPGVYVVGGAPDTWHQRMLGACMAAGGLAVASHRSAARIWGLLGEDDLVELSVLRPKGPRPAGALWHRSRDLVRAHTTVREGLPATNPMRTLVDLGAVVPPWILEDALDRALMSKLVRMPAVEWMLHDVARPGRRGCGVLRKVLDERALGAAAPDGLLEPRMARLLRDHGLPAAVFQHIPQPGYKIDFAYPDVLLAIEVDGYDPHGTRRAFDADRVRQNRLVLLGWTVLRFTWPQVVRQPGKVAAQVRDALGVSLAVEQPRIHPNAEGVVQSDP
jgi:very-short-patch-repair endonuclease